MSTSSCGCVWERSEYGDVIVSVCAKHRVPIVNGEPMPDGEDRIRWILDQLVVAANKGKRVAPLRPPDATKK